MGKGNRQRSLLKVEGYGQIAGHTNNVGVTGQRVLRLREKSIENQRFGTATHLSDDTVK